MPQGKCAVLTVPVFVYLASSGCTQAPAASEMPPPTVPPAATLTVSAMQAPASRAASLPQDAHKMTPAEDAFPPVLHAEGWHSPTPLEGSVNTAGAEDSPFVTPDGQMLLLFFTPDVGVPPEGQLLDGVTGIYASFDVLGAWTEPVRVMLQDPGKAALDGCGFYADEVIWFCSAREGFTGLHWFTAQYRDGKWSNWQLSEFDPSYEVGELHIHGDELYFHSARAGGEGGRDIWVSQRVDGEWQEPQNLTAINSPEDEALPFVTANGEQLWFTRTYQGSPAIYRSMRVNGEWQPPELILSQFAGEPTLDPEGNIYFVHHYYQDGTMMEADIYVAYRASDG